MPVPTADDAAFWRSGETGRLHLHRCEDCGRWHHPPRPVCPSCRSRAVAPRPVSGLGTVYTFTVNHQRWFASVPPPDAVAVVELDEQPGLRVTAGVVGCPPESVHIGQRVVVDFEQVDERVWLPSFTPVTP